VDDKGANAGTTAPVLVVVVLGATAGAASAGVGTADATAVEGVGARPGTPAVVLELSMPAMPPASGLCAFEFVSRPLAVGAPAAGAGASTVPLASITVPGAGAATDSDGAGAGTPACT
jgi:hypothetical protein